MKSQKNRVFPRFLIPISIIAYASLFVVISLRRFGSTTFQKVNNSTFPSLYGEQSIHIAQDYQNTQEIKSAFIHAWNYYEKYCWGQDLIVSQTQQCKNHLNASLTIVDSLSTLYTMGLQKQFEKSVSYIEHNFAPNGYWRTSEIVTHYVGGFLSAFELAGNIVLLEKAKNIADAILLIRDKKTGILPAEISIRTSIEGTIVATPIPGKTTISDFGSFQIEFFTLSKYTGDAKYLKYALLLYKSMWNTHPVQGLISAKGFIDIGKGSCEYYESIIKTYLLTHGRYDMALKRHVMMVKEIQEKLLFKTAPNEYYVIGKYSLANSSIIPESDHVSNFASSMIAIGAVIENGEADNDLKIAGELAETYYHMYLDSPSGVQAELMEFSVTESGSVIGLHGNEHGLDFWPKSSFYRLRPEAVESMYTLWRISGKPKWRNYAWSIFQGINRAARADEGFGCVTDVKDNEPSPDDIMESYFMSETLKYLFLIFDSNHHFPISEWVFNSRGHPFKIWSEKESSKWEKYFI